MNVAALELSRELFEISGWDGTFCHWIRKWEFGHTGGTWGQREGDFEVATGWVEDEDGEEVPQLPAYDLGYLMRRLPETSQIFKMPTGSYRAWRGLETFEAEKPEDAACKLVIELFKLGALAREVA